MKHASLSVDPVMRGGRGITSVGDGGSYLPDHPVTSGCTNPKYDTGSAQTLVNIERHLASICAHLEYIRITINIEGKPI